MATKKIVPRDAMDSMVAKEARGRGVSDPSGQLNGPARQEQERCRLKALLLDGANSKALAGADSAYFAGLREHIARRSDTAS